MGTNRDVLTNGPEISSLGTRCTPCLASLQLAQLNIWADMNRLNLNVESRFLMSPSSFEREEFWVKIQKRYDDSDWKRVFESP
jgi:hypothetical protein